MVRRKTIVYVILGCGILLGILEVVPADLEKNTLPRLETFQNHKGKKENTRPDAAIARIVSTAFKHESPVVCVAFSPDSKVLASGSRDVKLWSVPSGREMQHFSCRGLGVRQMLFSPDGKYLAVLGKEMRLFDLSTGRVNCHCQARSGVNCHCQLCSDDQQMMMFSPDGKNLAVVAPDNSIRVWNTATGNEISQLRGSSDPILALSFCKKGNYLASIQHRRLILWDPASGNRLKKFSLDVDDEGSYSFSPDGRLLAFKSEENFAHEEGSKPGVTIWETDTGRLRSYIAGDFSCIVFSPDSKRIGCVYFEFDHRYAEVWDLKTGKSINQYRVGPDHQRIYIYTVFDLIASAAFSPDGKILIITWNDHPWIERWDVATGASLKSYFPSEGTWPFKFSPDGAWLAVAGGGKNIELWDNRTGQIIRPSKVNQKK